MLTNFTENIQKARAFAVVAHGDQKYGEHPYVYHLDQVAELCYPYGEFTVVVAYLHDVLEDTPVTRDELAKAFGIDVEYCVSMITDPVGSNRRERKTRLYARLRALSVGAAIEAFVAKVADRLANAIESKKNNPKLFAMYQREHAEFSRNVYVIGVCDELWKQLDEVLR